MSSASLSWLRSQGSDIVFRCRWCGWQPLMDIDVAIGRFGSAATLDEISPRLVCRALQRGGGICGHRDAVAEPTNYNEARRGASISDLERRLQVLAERDRSRLSS